MSGLYTVISWCTPGYCRKVTRHLKLINRLLIYIFIFKIYLSLFYFRQAIIVMRREVIMRFRGGGYFLSFYAQAEGDIGFSRRAIETNQPIYVFIYMYIYICIYVCNNRRKCSRTHRRTMGSYNSYSWHSYVNKKKRGLCLNLIHHHFQLWVFV